MEFFNQAIDILKILVMALGAGLAVWGVINLLEGYGIGQPWRQMLMCHKVTHKNLIDSSPLFRYYLTHTPCNFFVKPIDSDTSEEI